MRPLRRDAVSGLSFQIGVRTASTSAVVISLTGFERIGPAYLPKVITHCA